MKDIPKIHRRNWNMALEMLLRYEKVNSMRDKIDPEEDEKGYRRLDKMCQDKFDKHLDYLYRLPKYLQKEILKLY